MSKPRQLIEKFIADPLPNTWIRVGGAEIYVRKSFRLVSGRAVRAFDIANVQVSPAKRGRGVFTRWHDTIAEVAKANGFEALYVESVMSPIMEAFVVKRGYVMTCPPPSPSFIKAL